MYSPLIEQAQQEFTQSGKHDLLAPLWRLCESGGFPSETKLPQWDFEHGVVSGNSIHLKFLVHFTEEAPSCCANTPSLRPVSRTVYITKSIETGEFETYADASTSTPNWATLFDLSTDSPSYEDSFS